MKPVLTIANLEEQDHLAEEDWLEATAQERFYAVEMIRLAAWELYGKPSHGLEGVLRIASFPPR